MICSGENTISVKGIHGLPGNASGSGLPSTGLFPTSMSYPANHLLPEFILLAL
jgi:hypothetical protein